MENDIEQPLLQNHGEEEHDLNTYITSNEYNQHHPRTFWQELSFNWISPLLRLGFTLPQLQQHHLPPLPPQAASDVCGDTLWQAWEREINAARTSARSPSLLRALFNSFGWNFLALGGLKFVNDALNFAGPVLLNGLLRYLDASSTGNGAASETAVSLPLVVPTATALAPSPTTTEFSRSFSRITGYYPFLDPTSDIFGAGHAALLAFTFFFKAFLNAQFSYRQGVISSQVRAALTSLCFRQSLSLSTSQVSTVGSGRIQTLMAVDADKVLGLFIGFHELWSLPFQIGLALNLLYIQVHFAFLAGLILVLLIIPLNKLLANGIQRASVTMMAAKDQRIAIIAELLKGNRVIKACNWEKAFAARVDVARKKELNSLAIRKYLDALCVYLWAATSLLFSLGTFGLFVLLGQKLTAQTVFTSLALFSVLLGPINSFPWVINGIVEAVVSLGRFRAFLTLRSPRKNTQLLLPPLILTTTPINSTSDLAIEIRNSNFQWSPPTPCSHRQNEKSSPTLQDINFSVPKGSFVVVTGHVGSGKSSLFNAILGEMYTTGPTASIQGVRVTGKTAYAAQDAWLMPGTIKQNILLASSTAPPTLEFPGVVSQESIEDADQAQQPNHRSQDSEDHHQRYLKILHACALSTEELSSLSRGDNTHVGDAGSTVSGGQRARIALARALYSNADVYLLDDVLAAVDAKVGAWLIDHVLLGNGGDNGSGSGVESFLEDKTVVIATHSEFLMKAADIIVTMREGMIEKIEEKNNNGRRANRNKNYSDVIHSGSGTVSSSSTISSTEPNGSTTSMNGQQKFQQLKDGQPTTITTAVAAADTEENDHHEMRAVGHVRWSIYRLYINMQGIWAPITLLSLALMQATRNGSDLWLSYWVSSKSNNETAALTTSASFLPTESTVSGALTTDVANSSSCFFTAPYLEGTTKLEPEVKFYLGILLYIAAANSIFTLIRAFSFAQGGLVAARRLHSRLVTSILSLPATFFDLNPSGRILNRFSSDTAIADDSLPFISNIFLAQLFGLAGVALVLSYTQPYLLIALFPIIFAYRILQRYYRATSRELRRLEAIAKSPVYTTFSAALTGGTTIRAFQGVPDTFLSSAHQAIDAQQRASLAALAASTWLGLRLQIIAGVIAALVGGLAVAQHVGLVPGAYHATSAGFVGLSLAYALPITGLLNGLLTSGAETEQEMVSVERIGQYIFETPQVDTRDNSSSLTTRSTTTTTTTTSSSNIGINGASILFLNVYMKYTASSPYVLSNFNLDLPAGTHAGICGRTGAGKSSAVSCLLRLAEISSGQILVDGVDIRTIPLCLLRCVIGFVPQSPFLFSGTVAENIDPVGKYSNDAIVNALKTVGLWPALSLSADTDSADGLSASTPPISFSVEQQDEEENLLIVPPQEEETRKKLLNLRLGNEGGVGLSQGQQQMLCLARVVLQSQDLKIMCLDEASASVDPGTAESMQQVVKTCFNKCTVIEVAHRLSSVAECDVVAVVDKGQVVEFGAPKVLAEDSRSVFAGMLREQVDKAGCSSM
ncbi:hypothetical protein Ndes2526B_g01656 [Nannochloris sp. 'desiccata']|nr:putative ABC transporter C family member 13 [Chlorella desiccata (nom. nud.)]